MDKDLLEVIYQSKGVLVIDFYQQDCGPCKLMEATVDGLLTDFPGIAVMKIDVAAYPVVAMQFGVTAFPTFFILRDGRVRDHFAGRVPAERLRQRVATVVYSV